MALAEAHDPLPAPPEQDTNLELRRMELSRRTAVLVLQAFHCPAGVWQPLPLAAGKDRLRIGSNPYEADLPVRGEGIADVQVVLQKFGRRWHIVECGSQRLLAINGFPRAQGMLEPDTACWLRLGQTVILLRLNAIHPLSRDDSAKELPQGPPGPGEYSLMTEGCCRRLPFDRTALIGTSPLCEVRTGGGALFAALLTPHAGRLCLLNLTPPETAPPTVDGVVADHVVPLHPGSEIAVAGASFKLRLAKELRFVSEAEGTAPVPTGRFRLLRLDADGHPVAALPLPAPGGTFAIGRSVTQADVAFADCDKLSRRHVQLLAYERTVLVIDLDSRNGTFINGERIKRRNAHPGDLVTFANLDFLLGYDETGG